MRRTSSAITRPLVGLFIGLFLSSASEARDRDRHANDDGWNPSVGRNASDAITSGLAEQGAGWLDTMANFYADPCVDNRGYFDYYRRPYYGHPPAERRR